MRLFLPQSLAQKGRDFAMFLLELWPAMISGPVSESVSWKCQKNTTSPPEIEQNMSHAMLGGTKQFKL